VKGCGMKLYKSEKGRKWQTLANTAMNLQVK
jgi:hypothetical protein